MEIKSKNKIITGIVLSALLVVVVLYGVLLMDLVSVSFPNLPFLSYFPGKGFSKVKGVEKFTSVEDFKAYLQKSQEGSFGFGGFEGTMMRAAEAPVPLGLGEDSLKAPQRVSTTNVQVAGIDEPDIVKTDGKEIYFSTLQYYYWKRYYNGSVSGKTRLIKAFPPGDLSVENKIDKTGNLLLNKNILVVFSGDKIYGYNVSNLKSPEKKWTVELDESNSYIVTARLYKDKVYLINSTRIDSYHPCPIKPLSIDGEALNIKCGDIYHPVSSVPVDVTYTAMVLNPTTGKIEKNISFVGSSGQSVVYMSEDNLFITYSYNGDFIKFFYGFFDEKCEDIIPSWVIEKLRKLTTYDISDAAKMTEFQVILQQYQSSLNDDERLMVENELSNRMTDYSKTHRRDLSKTGIVKIGLDNLGVVANGEVPGTPLNQFSLDEYNNYLRVAVTVGGNWGPIGGQIESANDVYVLDKKLGIAGSVKDLGEQEKIYSARFLGDKGYLVTFRQVDPFFVLDLSNPKKPELKGELKIPGFSSYLHPITENRILGVGQENWQVKISLFDVSSADDPKEISKYILNDSWSEVSQTHHAFLLDSKHQIFFLPGSNGGYVFSYKNDNLEMKKAISNIRARRALYIDDYLYVIGDDKIVVLSETDWTKVNTLEFEEENTLPRPMPLE